MITKKCDSCGKFLTGEDDEFVFSPWVIFHHKKRRDFCSNECITEFFRSYFNDSEKLVDKKLEEALHYLEVLNNNSSTFQPEIREAILFFINKYKK